MKKNKFGIDLIVNLPKRYNYIGYITVLFLFYQLIFSDFDIKYTLKTVLVTFLFGTFISYIYSTFLNLYKPTSFLNWWWKIYALTVLFKIILNHI